MKKLITILLLTWIVSSCTPTLQEGDIVNTVVYHNTKQDKVWLEDRGDLLKNYIITDKDKY